MSQTTTAAHETEKELIQRAQTAVSQCNWTVGECAVHWTKKFARGRTDADFGELVGMSGDQVYQRRRVCETFSDVKDNYSALKWSHFYIALNWDNAAECLSWASENSATIAEMKAWRRLQRGEDVTAMADDEPPFGNDGASVMDAYDSDRPGVVRAEGDLDLPASRASMTGGVSARRGETADAATLSAADSEYSPFRTGAVKPPPEVFEDVPGGGPPVGVEQSIKRLATMLERCAKAITPDVQRQFGKLPEKVRVRFVAAVRELRERTADLK
ncbi:MAG: hypothetical protein ACKV2Q_05245 [Planctomycetaceae bacterium]